MKKTKKTKKSAKPKLLLTAEKIRDLRPDQLREAGGAACYTGTHLSGTGGSCGLLTLPSY